MSAERRLLSPPEIAERMAVLDGWTQDGASIRGVWTFADFQEAFAFLTRVAFFAEKANHHPEIHNVWNRVELVLSTHDVGGLTSLDFDLAQRINTVAG